VGEKRVRGTVGNRGKRRRGRCLMPPVSDHLDCKQVKATRATSPRTFVALHLLREQPELADQEIRNAVGVAVDGGACGRVWGDEAQ
jgi:hypothetical protein